MRVSVAFSPTPTRSTLGCSGTYSFYVRNRRRRGLNIGGQVLENIGKWASRSISIRAHVLRYGAIASNGVASGEIEEHVSRTSRTGEAGIGKADGFSRSLITGSRVLMCLIALLLAVAPWTEHFGTFDNFPHGQDFELSLLAFLALLCLVLLLAVLRKRGLKDIFAVRAWGPLVVWEPGGRPKPGFAWTTNACNSPPLPSPSLGTFNLPLQI